MKKTKKQPKPTFDFLGIEIEHYDANIDISINHKARDKRYIYSNPKVFHYYTKIEIQGPLVYPDERMPGTYNITIYGDEREDGEFTSRLDNYHVRGNDGDPIYRKDRGKEIPIFDAPSGVGYLEKIRGTDDWKGCAWLPPVIVTNMLTLLPHVSPLYLAIHELKIDRVRWMNGISLQTIHPSIE